ncbi:hypothetical protein V6N12_044995 [Hibiscus sabdariffa]|uniref:DUF4283 domain-containing protein n=1 Tax=Hibiscus sabdariffa TaxID=183260 RepID=A0ABR2G2J4_9ROSI
MASNIPQSQFEGLDLTHEEQDSIFTPSVVWDIPSIDLAVLLIGKLFATKDVDIRLLFYRIHFETESKCQEILDRGPWLFKDDWLVLALLILL